MATIINLTAEEISNKLNNTYGTNTGDETPARIGALIVGAAEKTTPADADMLALMDSEATPITTKKLSWASVKAALLAAFPLLGKTVPSGDLVGSSDTQTLTNKRINGQRFKNNFSTAAQTLTAATRTYIAGSNINFAAGDLQVGTMFRWVIDVTKTAAGTAASTIDICFGTAGTTADTARVSFTKPAGTAVIDNGRIVIEAIVRGPVGASGVVAGHFELTHNLSTTGLATVPAINVTTISAAFDITSATNIGVCITTGASDAYTIQMVMTEARNI